MEDKDESVLRAGFLLRRMRELAEQADTGRGQLKQIQEEAHILQEKWQALMMNFSGSNQEQPAARANSTSAVARLLVDVLLKRRLQRS
jgi:hypothetical protein